MTDDFPLLSAWRAGDQGAGRRLVDRHFGALYRFFANKVDDDVDDLIQDTFLACVEGLERFRGDATFRTYLFAVARNKLYRHWRDRRPGAGEDFSVSQLAASTMAPADAIAKGREQRLLLRSLRMLPLDLQVLIELSYFEGLSDREVAEIVEVPMGTIKSRLRKGRALLHEAMQRSAEPGLVTSTHDGFDGWCDDIRRQLVRGPDDGAEH